MWSVQKQIPFIIQRKIVQEDGELEINYVHKDTQEHFVNNVTFITLEVMDHILYHRCTRVDYALIQEEIF